MTSIPLCNSVMKYTKPYPQNWLTKSRFLWYFFFTVLEESSSLSPSTMPMLFPVKAVCRKLDTQIVFFGVQKTETTQNYSQQSTYQYIQHQNNKTEQTPFHLAHLYSLILQCCKCRLTELSPFILLWKQWQSLVMSSVINRRVFHMTNLV